MMRIPLRIVKKCNSLLHRIKLDFNLLTYDIETAHLKARIWRPGEQRVGHDQLLKNGNKHRILTITYKWWHKNETVTLTCGEDGLNQKKMIVLFDAQVKKADVIIGKNNHNFDDKHVNTIRMLEDGTPMPEWAFKSDDLEKQLRRFFNFPSHALAYISDILGFGGKIKMERQDWVDIEDLIEYNRMKPYLVHTKAAYDAYCQFYFHKTAAGVVKFGREKFLKMIGYNQKDSTDTEGILNKVMPHIQLKYNAATSNGFAHGNGYSKAFSSPNSCITCGSNQVKRQGKIYRGKQRFIEFYCLNHKGYAGARGFRTNAYHNIKFTGKMGK